MANEITVGNTPVSRAGQDGGDRTYIEGSLPANLGGELHTVNLYVVQTIGGTWKVGVFYQTTGNNFKCRSAQSIGTVAAGLNNKALSPRLAIVQGDYIGVYLPSSLEQIASESGALTLFWAGGDHCVVDNEATYTQYPGTRTMSEQGRGDYVPSGEMGIVI